MSSTMHQVAIAAGVSVSTVSRVFTAPSAVRASTRDRVLAAANRLDFDPAERSRAGTRPRSRDAARRTLGMIVPDIANPFFGVLAKSVQTRAHAKGCTVLLGDSDERAADEYDLAMTMVHQIDGLLLVSSHLSAETRRQVTSLVPTTIINQEPDGLPSVLATSADGVAQAVEHLVALGHRRLGYVNGPRASWSNRHRQVAAGDAATRLGVELVQFGPYESRFDSGMAAADQVLATDVSGVIAHNDLMAMGMIRQLARRGVAVPGQISLIGIDDISMTVTSDPQLTTVRLPLREMGLAAVDVMLDRLGDPAVAPAQVRLASSLVVRESTAPAGRSRARTAPDVHGVGPDQSATAPRPVDVPVG